MKPRIRITSDDSSNSCILVHPVKGDAFHVCKRAVLRSEGFLELFMGRYKDGLNRCKKTYPSSYGSAAKYLHAVRVVA